MTFKLKKNIKIDKASLNVKDLYLLMDFYTDKIGFDLIKEENNRALLGLGEKVILELVQVERGANKKLQDFTI